MPRVLTAREMAASSLSDDALLPGSVTKFTNCRLVRGHHLVAEDLWVRCVCVCACVCCLYVWLCGCVAAVARLWFRVCPCASVAVLFLHLCVHATACCSTALL
jgi:hypothetical protein